MIKKNVALDIVGGFSAPSKMPCHGFSIPAKYCKVGSILRKVKGTACSFCYALKGRYVFPVVQNALERRFNKLNDPQWVDAMADAINQVEKSGCFRWFDSGDLQSVDMLKNIVEVCKKTPKIKHWVPTREYQMVSDFLVDNQLPANLTIRLSAIKVDGEAPTEMARKLGVVTSTISTGDKYNCVAPKQGGKCLDCRKCWNKSVFNISYHKH